MKRTRILTECAVSIALATILSLCTVYEAPLGGSVTAGAMVPIILISFLHGPAWGLGSGLVFSVIQLLFGLKNVAYVPSLQGIILCILLDYILPFTLIGLAGLAAKLPVKRPPQTVLGSFGVCLLRLLFHILSGAVVWYSITKEGAWNEAVFRYGMWTYATIYNLTFMIPETIITMLAVPLIDQLLGTLHKHRT